MTSYIRLIYGASFLVIAGDALAQDNGARPRVNDDSVVVQASKRYGASGFHRYLLGDNYRDLWAQPITVPLLDLGRYAGGLTPLEEGGNAQTRNLHLRGADGREYVFRPVFKEVLQLPDVFRNTVIEDLFADGLSASHPAATVISAPFLDAAGVLAANPILYVMPDDSRLGEFRDFAGKLGTMEEFPEDPDDRPGFGGALDIIDSEDLLEKLNEDAETRYDAHALLTARLVDMLIGDNDRHPGQWKWAMIDDRWVPIPRDRDKAFVSYEGRLLDLARLVLPRLVTFRGTHATAMFYNAIEFDRRLLVSLDRADFDSTARFLKQAITDSVVGAALSIMPREYRTVDPDLTAAIRARRDNLPNAAAAYYRALFTIVDLHTSDDAERAAVTRHDDGSVQVRITAGGRATLDRRFLPDETREIRLYLHGGADTAVVAGTAPRSIPLWIIGGPGFNVLVDSSRVGGRAAPTHLYDRGDGPAPAAIGQQDSTGYDPDTSWNRRPVVRFQGWHVPQWRDRGSSLSPSVGLSTGRGLGIVPSVGLRRVTYGFRQYPYASKVELDVKYATAISAWEVELTTDNRIENSRMFWKTESEVSQLLSGRFRGFGNDTPPLPDDVEADFRQTHVLLQPSIGWALGPVTEVTVGPIAKYSVTDSQPGTFIAADQPYGFRRFGQAGVQLRFLHESTREVDDKSLTESFTDRGPARGLTFEASAAAYPAVWGAEEAFGSVAAVAAGHVTLPLPLRPVLAARAGGKVLFGEFPYFEAAFLGGGESVRTLRRQRYAGDASLYGSAELRIPVAEFAFVFPLNTGILGFVDAGRVYMDGKSPGGWHRGMAAGFWLGFLKPSTSLTVVFTDQRDRRVLVRTGFDF